MLLTRHPPGGTLETNVTDVTVVTPTTPPETTTAPPPKPKPPQTEPVDRRCWTMFGGGPRRTLARPAIELGIPAAKPIWARGLRGYIEYPASYCDGVLYVNTFKGDTWAIEAATGDVLWRKLSDAPKPSTPAIAGDKLIISSKDGTVTALTRKNGKVVWQLETHAKVESSPAIAGDIAYFGATDGRLFAVDVDTGHVQLGLRHRRPDQLKPFARGRPHLHHDVRGLDLLPPPARRAEAVEHVREARRVPLRELLREPVDRWAAALHHLPVGEDRHARRR